MDLPDVAAARQELLDVCNRLKDECGTILIDKQSKDQLKKAVEALENLSEPPTLDTHAEEDLVGPWTLLCTTSTTRPGLDKSKLPPIFKEGPLQTIRDTIREAANRFITVQQVIKGEGDETGWQVNRVDHVISYSPPKKLQELVDNLPEQLTSVDINPLDVSKSKLTLVHDAKVLKDDTSVALKTKLNLKSIVLNVAGTSTLLDPEGRDLVGINLPLSEFIANSASNPFAEFETTYIDHDLRISRSRGNGIVDDQLRVFVRSKEGDQQAVALDDDDVEDDENAEKVDAELVDDHDGQDDVSPSDY